MLKSKRIMAEEDRIRQSKLQLERQLEELNSQGRARGGIAFAPSVVCETKHPMELARKLAKRYPAAEFTIVVPSDGYDDQAHKICMRPAWDDVVHSTRSTGCSRSWPKPSCGSRSCRTFRRSTR